jgi:hypothetical protein
MNPASVTQQFSTPYLGSGDWSLHLVATVVQHKIEVTIDLRSKCR